MRARIFDASLGGARPNDMITDWMPPVALGAAIFCGCAMPLLLILLGRTSSALRRPGPRYRVSVQAAWLLFFAALVGFWLAGIPIGTIDYIAGAAIMLAATVLAFIAWSLIAWGFTLSMLLALAKAKRVARLDDWIRHYTGGADFRRLAADRAAVLLVARLAVMTGENGFRLTALGRVAARFVAVGQWTFGIRSAEWNSRP
jgi:hypothetical protein